MGIFKSLIGTVLLTLLVTVIILINISIFLIYSPDPSTEHYLHVKNVNLTAAAASNTTDGSNNHKSATRTKKPISPKLVPSENSTVQYFHLPHSLDAAIAYEISGPENGYPVFMMHDLPGSKNWVHINESQLLELHGIKLIRFDRLGLGHSATDRALLNKLQQSQESSGKKLAPKKQRNKQQQARQVQQKQQQKLHSWETFMEWFNSFLNNDKAKQVKFTVANSVESEFIPLVNHVLKDNSQHFSIVGYGMGAPFALAALRSKQWNVSRIDSVSLLAPLGQPTSTQDKNVDDWEEGCYLYQQIHKWANHPEHQYRAELAIRALWSAASKFGLVTHHEAWPKLFRPCMNTDDVQLLFSNTTVSDQWLNVFNRTMIDLYMQGTSTHMNQLIALMRPNGWGFDPSEISTTTSKLQFLYSDVDRFAPAALVERLYNSVCSKSSNTCTKQLTSGVGHFALFNQAFNETLSFLARNAQFSSARNSPTTKIDPINTTSKEEARKEETTSDKMMKKFSSTFLTKASPSPTKRIIVVGTGLAGFSAAIEAVHYAKNHKNQLVKVLMLDKEERIGGNSAKASSGMNALSNDDDAQQFYNDVIKSGGGLSNETLVHILVDQSHDALEFLTRVAHIDMSVVTQCGGHSHQRTFRNYVDPNDPRPKNVGFEIISKMNQLVTGDEDEDLKKSIEIVNGANVVGFLTNEDNNSANPTVVGVKVQIKESEEVEQLYAESVILATGGYGQDRRDLLHKFAPDWMQELPSTNGAFSTGDMIKLVHEQLKGQMIHMDQIQVHPTGFINPKDPNSKTVFLAAEALRAYGGILINQQGSRFTNELGTRDRITNDILSNCTNQGIDYKWAFLVINQYVVDHFGKNLMQFYISKGFFTKHDNAADFASTYQLNPATVQTTLDEYNSHVNNKTPDQFGKTLFPTTVDPNETLYVAKITPSIHYTMGGLKFDANARVLNERDQPIPGLYAAGEVTGSLHGRNRLAGNSLLETVVFGRISGRAAVGIDA